MRVQANSSKTITRNGNEAAVRIGRKNAAFAGDNGEQSAARARIKANAAAQGQSKAAVPSARSPRGPPPRRPMSA